LGNFGIGELGNLFWGYTPATNDNFPIPKSLLSGENVKISIWGHIQERG
jgi:hypothetical protein